MNPPLFVCGSSIKGRVYHKTDYSFTNFLAFPVTYLYILKLEEHMTCDGNCRKGKNRTIGKLASKATQKKSNLHSRMSFYIACLH